MAEIFLGGFVNVLVEKLASGDLWNFARTERIGTQLTKWKSMLAQVQAVVADAEEKQMTDLGVNLWLSDLEDMSYDMDDVLDEFATEALRRKVMEEPRASTSKMDSAQRVSLVLMTAPECASLLFSVLSSVQYLSCFVLSLQRFPTRYLSKFQNHTLEARKGVGKSLIKAS